MNRKTEQQIELTIDSLAHDGRGVGKHNGKAVFVDGALPGEKVSITLKKRRRRYDHAELVQVITSSDDRIEPRCEHFGQCGGCSLQHMRPEKQISYKHTQLQENLQRIGKVEPQGWLAPLQASGWAYRRKARLGLRYVHKKGRVLVGFREKGSSFITDTRRCEILYPSVGLQLEAIAAAVNGLSIRDQVPQIEVAVGSAQTCLIFRVLADLNEQDIMILKELAAKLEVSVLLQPAGPDSIYPLNPMPEPLYYDLPDWQLRMLFEPQDFTQVNMELNQLMIRQALEHLQLTAEDRVLDLFCGLGNFSLPIARSAAFVLGVEGDAEMVRRAEMNAAKNQISNCEFHAADLFTELAEFSFLKQGFNKVLLDPPRSGAEQAAIWLSRKPVERIVYVSCNPATLARDAEILVHQGGYTLEQAGAMDMFPHTAHTEAMAVFSRKKKRG